MHGKNGLDKATFKTDGHWSLIIEEKITYLAGTDYCILFITVSREDWGALCHSRLTKSSRLKCFQQLDWPPCLSQKVELEVMLTEVEKWFGAAKWMLSENT